jgi:hypothetical protein
MDYKHSSARQAIGYAIPETRGSSCYWGTRDAQNIGLVQTHKSVPTISRMTGGLKNYRSIFGRVTSPWSGQKSSTFLWCT